MNLESGIRRLLRLPPSDGAVEREVNDELRFHLESRVDALIARGLTRQAAEAQARTEFGDVRAAHAEIAAIARGPAVKE